MSVPDSFSSPTYTNFTSGMFLTRSIGHPETYTEVSKNYTWPVDGLPNDLHTATTGCSTSGSLLGDRIGQWCSCTFPITRLQYFKKKKFTAIHGIVVFNLILVVFITRIISITFVLPEGRLTLMYTSLHIIKDRKRSFTWTKWTELFSTEKISPCKARTVHETSLMGRFSLNIITCLRLCVLCTLLLLLMIWWLLIHTDPLMSLENSHFIQEWVKLLEALLQL